MEVDIKRYKDLLSVKGTDSGSRDLDASHTILKSLTERLKALEDTYAKQTVELDSAKGQLADAVEEHGGKCGNPNLNPNLG